MVLNRINFFNKINKSYYSHYDLLDVEFSCNDELQKKIINTLYDDLDVIYLYGDNDIFLNCCNTIDINSKLNYYIYSIKSNIELYELLDNTYGHIHCINYENNILTYYYIKLLKFNYNYKKMKERMKVTIAEDLMKNRFHPKYMDKWLDWGQVEAEDFT